MTNLTPTSSKHHYRLLLIAFIIVLVPSTVGIYLALTQHTLPGWLPTTLLAGWLWLLFNVFSKAHQSTLDKNVRIAHGLKR